ELATEFTSNRGRLLAGADRFEGGFSTGVYCGSDHDYCQADEHRTMRYLETLAKWLDGVDDRRKALLFISEGFDSGISDVFAPQSDPDGPHVIGSNGLEPKAGNLAGLSAAAGDARDVIDAATRSSVSIYAIDPRGLPGSPAPTIKPVTTLVDDDPGKIVIAQQGLAQRPQAGRLRPGSRRAPYRESRPPRAAADSVRREVTIPASATLPPRRRSRGRRLARSPIEQVLLRLTPIVALETRLHSARFP
ncbi:MAG TPA: hypothetical protein VGG73_22615, partial [Vicinamibacterales bacterium]